MVRLLRNTVAALFLATPVVAQPYSAIVADVETGIILTADRIDGPRNPDLLGRLLVVAMGIQDVADGTLDPAEEIRIRADQNALVAEALQMSAMGSEGYRAPLTALAARLGHNAEILEKRIEALQTRVGMRGTELTIERGRDGGPEFVGRTTIRDVSRLAVSLLRAHGSATATVFEPAIGNASPTWIWMTQDDTCLLAAKGPRTGRLMVAGITGAPDDLACFEAAAEILSENDTRILSAAAGR
jgi:hypothetical protein